MRRSLYAASLSIAFGATVLVGCGASSNEARDAGKTQGALNADLKAAAKNATPAVKDESDKSVGIVAAALGATAAEEARGGCRPGMVSIEGRFCIDKYEASLVETSNGEEHPWSPFATPKETQHVRAVSEAGVTPQGYISRNQAEKACMASGKRLCDVKEWQQACRGPEKKQWGYGDERVAGKCNDNGNNPVMTYYGPRYDASTMNKPELNQMDGTLAKTGERTGCSNSYGVYDMVGNLHEWVADPNGTFYGGFYQDVASPGHGEGCGYKTTAHEARYHDYSTGFRCCADAQGSESAVTVSPAEDPPAAPAPTPVAKKKKKKKPH